MHTLRLPVLAAPLLLFGCDPPGGPASTLELTLQGTLQHPLAGAHAIDVSGAWPKACDDCSTSIQDGGDVGWLSPSFRAPTPEGEPVVTVSFDLANNVRVGPGAHPLDLGLEGSGASPVFVSDGVVVDRSFLTGDPARPWQVDVLIDGVVATADGSDATMSGAASLVFRCEESVDPSRRCGGDGTGPYDAIAETTLSYTDSGLAATCPAAVREHFWRPQGLLTGDAAAHTVRIGDAAPMGCLDEQGVGFCGGTAEVEADGCTWRVDVLRDGELTVNAKASGCERENPYCSDVFFPQPAAT